MRKVGPALQPVLAAVFGVRRAWYHVRYPRVEIGPGVLLIGRLKVRHGTRVRIGAHARIRQTVVIRGGGEVEIGEHTLLNGCWIGARRRVSIGPWCLVSDCGITDSDFHNLPPRQRHEPAGAKALAPVTIGRNVWVGASALVLKGSVIGDDSVVGAGAVVRGTVDAGVVVAGNPARVVKTFAPEERTQGRTE